MIAPKVILDFKDWPPNYNDVFAWRQMQYNMLKETPSLKVPMLAYYAQNPIDWICHWVDTVDPRNSGNAEKLVRMPFIMFKRQAELVEFLEDCKLTQESGLIEKCRDFGATWIGAAYSAHQLLFVPGSAIGWGSRKQELVDKLGVMDSIFEKIRSIVRNVPDIFYPDGFNPLSDKTMSHMRILNNTLGSSITGEVGDNIGRGGRTSMYFKDEAQPLTAGILTPNGWKTMGDMKVGSIVCGPDGSNRSVTHINNAGKHDIYRITLSDSSYTDCSLNHLWKVDKVIGKRETLILKTCDIAKNLIYNSPKGQILYRYRLPIIEPVEFTTHDNYPLNPYIVGVLLGDGSINSGCITFTSIDDEIVNNVLNRLPSGCIIKKGEKYNYRIVDIVRYNKSSRAKNAVKASGIFGTLSYNKSIPEMYLLGSINNRLEVLQGLMDTDGSASGGTCTYHTSSKKLADNVRFIVHSLGGSASLNVKSDHRGYRDMYCLHLTLPIRFDFFKISRKNRIVNSRKRAFGNTIKSIEKVGYDNVRCITVDNDDGLYITDNCMVTHNSAHYERPELIEASLGDNTRVQIDISSVNGLGNVFHRRREAGLDWFKGHEIPKGITRVFVCDSFDHPEKTQEWYDLRKAKADREGLLHIFNQEVDRNYSSSVEGILIPNEWFKSAIDAHIKLNIEVTGGKMGSFDPGGDEGGDLSGFAARTGMLLDFLDQWGSKDTGVAARTTIGHCRDLKLPIVQYEPDGIGAGVKAEINRLNDDKLIDDIIFVPWSPGNKILNPLFRVISDDDESPMNKDHFHNFKAQASWYLRSRFEKTHKAVTEGIKYDQDELIFIDSKIPYLRQLEKEISQPTIGKSASLKMIIEKKPSGTRSPNLFDCCVSLYCPLEHYSNTPVIGISRG